MFHSPQAAWVMSRTPSSRTFSCFSIEFMPICFPNDILWSLKHVRTQIDYIHYFTRLETGVGFIVLLLDLRLEITSFHSPQASGGGRHVGFYRDGSRGSGFGQVYTGNHGLGLRQF